MTVDDDSPDVFLPLREGWYVAAAAGPPYSFTPLRVNQQGEFEFGPRYSDQRAANAFVEGYERAQMRASAKDTP